MKKIYLQWVKGIWLAMIGLVSGQLAWAQSIPDVQWTQSGSALAVTTDGGIVSTERLTQSTATSFNQVGDGLVKYAVQGNRLWATGFLKGGFYVGGKLPGYDYETIAKILLAAPTTDGGVAIMGKTSLRGANVVTRVNANGTPRRWEDTDLIGSSGESIFSDLIGTPDGGYLLLLTNPQTDAPSNVVIRKYDASGNFSWSKEIAYPTPNPATPDRSLTKGEALSNTPDGGYLIVGYYNTTGTVNNQANSSLTDNTGWAAKLDGQGTVVWQKLLNSLPVTLNSNGAVPGAIVKMYSATDVILSADGTGYALVGAALGAGSVVVPAPATAILEMDWSGNFKRAKSLGTTATQAFIKLYAGAGTTSYYAVGNTSLANGADPQILKVSTATVSLSDPALFSIAGQRTYDSPTDSYLQVLDRAGDGSLVFSDGSQITKLKVETTPLGLTAPTYNCQTGAITFNTVGGDGSPITYSAPGISRSSATATSGTVEAGLRSDPKVIPITATQSGVSVTYNFDLKSTCGTTTTPQPPVGQPIPDQSLTVGQSLPGSGFAVGNYFSDPNLGVIPNYIPDWSFTITGLPDGLYVFSRTQDLLYTPVVVILGTPTTAGIYTVTVKASTGAFRNNPIITSFKITVSATTPPPGNALVITAPTYNCQTGAITFNTVGGDGSPITYSAPGISRSSATATSGTVEAGLRSDPKVIPITATQSGVSVTYNFDLKSTCGTTTTPQPPVGQPIPDQSLTVGQSLPGNGFIIGRYFSDPTVNVPNYTPNWSFKVDGLPDGLSVFSQAPDLLNAAQPSITILGTPTKAGVYTVTITASTGAFRNNPIITSFKITVSATTPPPGNALVITAPTYNCQTGAITFNVSGGNGTQITYSAPGISRSSVTDNFGTVEAGLRSDPKVIPITATQSGVSVTYNFDLKSTCGKARIGAEEPTAGLQVRVLGNPVLNQTAELEITGVEGQTVGLDLVDGQGRILQQRTIGMAGSLEHVSLPMGQGRGLLLLQVHAAKEHQTVKLLKP